MLIFSGRPEPPNPASWRDVNGELRSRLAAGAGIVTRAEALAVVPVHVVDYALRAGQLVRLQHGVYGDPECVDRRLRLRAAVRHGECCGAVLSHTSALEVWGLWQVPEAAPIHLRTAPEPRLRGAGLVVHRAKNFTTDAPRC